MYIRCNTVITMLACSMYSNKPMNAMTVLVTSYTFGRIVNHHQTHSAYPIPSTPETETPCEKSPCSWPAGTDS